MTKEIVYSTRNNPMYNGKMSEYHTTAKRYKESTFNEYQNFLFNRAMYGLTVFSKSELDNMFWEKKKRINKVHLRTKKVLNIWKQQLTNKIFEKFFVPKFDNKKIEFAQDFAHLYANEVDESIDCNISFSNLGVSKKQIITKLIHENILPKDFYELKAINNDRLPWIKQQTFDFSLFRKS